MTNRRHGKHGGAPRKGEHRGALPTPRRSLRQAGEGTRVAALPSPTRPREITPPPGPQAVRLLAPPTTARSGYARATDGRTAQPESCWERRKAGGSGRKERAPHPAKVNDAGAGYPHRGGEDRGRQRRPAALTRMAAHSLARGLALNADANLPGFRSLRIQRAAGADVITTAHARLCALPAP